MPGNGYPAVPDRPRFTGARRRLPGWLLAVLLLGIPVLVIAGCTLTRGAGGPPQADKTDGFITAEGRGLVLDGAPVRLQAVNFSNFYHRNLKGAELLASQHHAREDFARAKDLGFNSVRFAFDGDWYVDSPDIFWQWLDRNVAWARDHGMRLILDLHTPIGGFWLDPTSDAVSFDLWSDPKLQQQNADLWRAIAARYRDEPAIAAYDLLNEPVTTDATGEQWKRLATKLVAAVRAEDPNHLLVVGGIYGVNGSYGAAGVDPHFLVDDGNVVYDFHFYEPIKYTHQYASWVEGPVRDGGSYPDPDTLLPTGDRILLPESRIATKPLPAGTTGWTAYDSGIMAIEDPTAVAATPLVTVQGGLRGTATFDAITVTEYGPDGAELRQLVNDRLDRDGTLDWHEWQYSAGAGAGPTFVRETAGHRDNGSLSISNVVDAGMIAGWSNDGHLFRVVPGNKYRIQGHMRGQDIAATGASTPAAALQIDVYAQSPGAAGGGFLTRGKDYLAHELGKRLKFGVDNNVPMSVMEFGLVRQAFEMEGKGGGQWVTDMLELLKENGLSFAYWEYHGTQMGLYLSGTGRPGEPNTALHEALARGLR